MDWSKLLKALIFVSHFIVFMTGVGLISVGSWSAVEKDHLKVICEKVVNTPEELKKLLNLGILSIALGVVLIVMGLQGCWKTLCKKMS